MRIEFDWDPAKAQSNNAKHGVNFHQAMRVFADPLALSRAAIRGRSGDLKDEYNFSDAERGKFFHNDAVLAPPIHLEADVLAYLLARAEARGASLDQLVNGLLRADIALIEAGG